MKRREFITLLGSGAVAWPLAARAQQANRIYQIGILILGTKGKLGDQQRAVLTKTLMDLGWTEGKNIQIEYRWAASDAAQISTFARELLSRKPDVILAQGTQTVATFQRETKTTPIVFVSVVDPVLSGAVASLAHPGGNITGFSNFEPTLVGKHVEILKELTPGMTAVVVMSNPDNPTGFITHPLYEAAARYHGVGLVFAPARNASEIEHVISGLGDKPTTGLSCRGSAFRIGAQSCARCLYRDTLHVRAVFSFGIL